MEQKKGKAFFGGSFDPVHWGHIVMARAALKELPVDEMTLIPTRLTGYKKRKLTEDRDRLRMLELAVKGTPGLSVSDMELTVPVEQNYTYCTLERLKERYPDREIFFLIGGDSLAYLDQWREPEKLFRLAAFVTAVRGDVDIPRAKELMKKYEKKFPGARLQLLRTDPPDISSTEIRMAVREGKTLKGLVPYGVGQYIRRRGLYLEPDERTE